MARQLIVWILGVLLLFILAVGELGCKKEEGQAPEGQAVQEEVAPAETTEPTEAPSEKETDRKTNDFEEEEGVQQEDEGQRDY